MFEILVLWAFLLAACLLVGEAACRLAGLARWSWLSGTLGLCVLLVIGAAAPSLPGHARTAFVLIVALALAAALRIAYDDRRELKTLARRALDPAALMLLVLAATLIPFFANGRVGLPGPSFNNDSHFHLWAAEYLVAGQTVPETVLGHGYPLGPHGLAAALAGGFGMSVELTFTALLMVVVVLTAFAARAVLTDLWRPAATLAALLTSLAYLLASFYAQAAFKETMLALFVLGLAALLRELVAQRRIGPRAAPLLALPAAGTVLVYSYPGLAWIVGTIGLAALGLLVAHRRLLRRDIILPTLRRSLPTLGVLAAVLVVALASQVTRLQAFFEQLSLSPAGSGIIPEANIGNLVGPVSPYEVLGIWLREDFRIGPAHQFRGGMLAAVALVALLFAVIWWLRRREVVVLATAAACGLLYVAVREAESAYLAAKALVILSPFPMLLVTRALLARAPRRVPELRAVHVAVTVVFVCAAGWSSLLALRNAQINPRATHQRELVSLRALLADRSVLFLGFDDYIGYRLFEAEVTDPPVQQVLPFELRKPFTGGEDALDFDSVTTQDAGSLRLRHHDAHGVRQPAPSNFLRVRRTASYEVFRRSGRTPPNVVLDGEDDGRGDARLRGQRSPPAAGGGRRRHRAGAPQAGARTGTARHGRGLHRRRATAAAVGGALGALDAVLQPAAHHRLDRHRHGLAARAQPRPARAVLARRRPADEWAATLRLALHLERAAPSILTADSQYAQLGKIAAVRTDVAPRWVPLRRACGRYVDRYRR